MAGSPRRLTVVVSPAANRDLDEIWDYNAERHSPIRANAYGEFLELETARLEDRNLHGKRVPGRPDLRSTTFRKGRGAGHVAIYRIVGEAIEILRYQHTAQDWRGKAQRGEL